MTSKTLISALAAAGATLVAAAPAGAQNPTVVADKLNNPRGVVAGPDGSIYIAESGRAGTTCIKKQGCFGTTGRISKLSPAGVKTTVATGFGSFGEDALGVFAGGISDVAVAPDGTVFTVQTTLGPTTPAGLPASVKRQIGRALRITGTTTFEPLGRVDAFELKNDPAKDGKESNPYGIAATEGHVYVADAAGNSLVEVVGSKVSAVATFPDASKGADSVPTVVRPGPDGALYVGELSGDKAPNGKARVWRVVPGEKPTVYAKGFSRVTGLAFGPDGALYVSELSVNFAKQVPDGRVVKVTKAGVRSVIGKGKLFYPAGVAVAPDNSVYVANWSVLPSSTPKKSPFRGAGGQVVKFTQG